MSLKFAEAQPQILRLRKPQKKRITTLRMTLQLPNELQTQDTRGSTGGTGRQGYGGLTMAAMLGCVLAYLMWFEAGAAPRQTGIDLAGIRQASLMNSACSVSRWPIRLFDRSQFVMLRRTVTLLRGGASVPHEEPRRPASALIVCWIYSGKRPSHGSCRIRPIVRLSSA